MIQNTRNAVTNNNAAAVFLVLVITFILFALTELTIIILYYNLILFCVLNLTILVNMSLLSKIQNDFQILFNLLSISSETPFFSTTKIVIFIAIIVLFCVVIQLEYNNEILSSKMQQEKEVREIENFTNRQNDIQPIKISINFAKATDARALFTDNSYLNTMNTINILARGLTDETLISFYQSSFQDITVLEEKYITKFIEALLNDLNKQDKGPYATYLKYWLERSIFAKSIPELEGNMPHTHKNYIIMPAAWYKYPNASTLIHELLHVHQRHDKKDFEILYRDFGFKYYDKNVHTIKGLEQNMFMSRHNPDGLDLNWIWCPRNLYKTTDDMSYFFITAKYPNIDNPSLTNVEYVAYSLNRDNSGTYYKITNRKPIKLSNLEIFKTHFGITNNHYHPNEIAAQYAEYYLDDSGVNKNYIDKTKRQNPGYKTFITWMNIHLGYSNIFTI